jgi:hypothetical protein
MPRIQNAGISNIAVLLLESFFDADSLGTT